MTDKKIQISIDIEQPAKVIDLLAEHCDLSKQQLKTAMAKGAVWLTNGRHTKRLRRSSKPLQPGQKLHLYYDESILSMAVEPALLIEDNQHYSVWYKPRGMFCQGSKWGDHCTITRFAEQNLEPQRNAFLVHRLDRATSGLILVGHSKKTTAQLCEMFQQRLLDKRYLAIVHGRFADKLSIDLPVDDKKALSHITLRQYDEQKDRSLIEVKIDTGRKHQIRKHVSSVGNPIVGDRLYGNGDHSEDLQLTAFQLSFVCPLSGQKVRFELPGELCPQLRIEHI